MLRRTLEINSRHKNTLRQMGKLLREQARYEEALEMYGRLLEIDPEDALAHGYTGNILFNLHRPNKAIESLNKALTLTRAARSLTPDLPTQEALHVLLGKASWEAGRLQAGEEHFRRALELNSRNTEALEHIAVSHFRQNRFQEALDLYRTLLEIDPDQASTYSNLGVALYQLGRFEEARQSLERARALDPTLEMAKTNLEKIRKTVRKPGESAFTPMAPARK